MAPFYNQGKEFRFETDLDDVLSQFFQIIDLFDSRESDRRRLMDLRSTPEFEKAYRELGSPDIWPTDPPGEAESRLVNPKETIKLHEKLSQSIAKQDRRTWRRYSQRFVDDTLAELRTTIDWICVAVHKQSVDSLLHTLNTGQDDNARRTALCDLVEFDPWFLVAPGADVIIRNAAISNDQEFSSRLSRALDPKRITKAYKKHRQQYALMVLSSLGYTNKSYADWARFFIYYNQQLGELSGKSIEYAFSTYESWQAIKEAIRAYGIPKTPIKPGRPKSQK